MKTSSDFRGVETTLINGKGQYFVSHLNANGLDRVQVVPGDFEKRNARCKVSVERIVQLCYDVILYRDTRIDRQFVRARDAGIVGERTAATTRYHSGRR